MDVLEREQLTSQQALGHWYYEAKFQLLLTRLRDAGCLRPDARIADVGCGMGLFMTLLERSGCVRPEQMFGIDPAHPQPTRAVEGHAAILPDWPDDNAVDVALLMDVLEHTPDDLAVLRQTADHVREGGHVFITVPAFGWLRSTHDRFLGHFRRYSCDGLRSLIGRCPELEIVDLHYFYASILPAAVPVRLARRGKQARGSDLKIPPPWLNGLLKWITRVELKLASRNRAAGLTAVALCRKVAPLAERQADECADTAPLPLGAAA